MNTRTGIWHVFQFTCLMKHHCPFKFEYLGALSIGMFLCCWQNLYCFGGKSNWLLRTPAPSDPFTATAVQRWQSAEKPKVCLSDWASLPASSGQCHLNYFHPQMPQRGQKSYESSGGKVWVRLHCLSQLCGHRLPELTNDHVTLSITRTPDHKQAGSGCTHQTIKTTCFIKPQIKGENEGGTTSGHSLKTNLTAWELWVSPLSQSSPVHYSHFYCHNFACCDLL